MIKKECFPFLFFYVFFYSDRLFFSAHYFLAVYINEQYSFNYLNKFFAGQRQYLVSTVERFWQWYKKQCNVSFYELIPQSRHARLYFDLEFYRETNPEVKEESLIKDFNDCVCDVFREMFDIDLNPNKVSIWLFLLEKI